MGQAARGRLALSQSVRQGAIKYKTRAATVFRRIPHVFDLQKYLGSVFHIVRVCSVVISALSDPICNRRA
jgi:hypothetical protein